MLTIRLAS